ncbi:hypothetical protein TGP89_207110 [Toxoplasma gondii p89]|uniref:Uncharacterized protein n=1 Tax=Toxoplasma gondii p89 TaxID=943119 RepID=A0A086J6V7_TOXGO|nr:hypothetical protein TGP89_207110 [Toxoplasma gondii p89]
METNRTETQKRSERRSVEVRNSGDILKSRRSVRRGRKEKKYFFLNPTRADVCDAKEQEGDRARLSQTKKVAEIQQRERRQGVDERTWTSFLERDAPREEGGHNAALLRRTGEKKATPQSFQTPKNCPADGEAQLKVTGDSTEKKTQHEGKKKREDKEKETSQEKTTKQALRRGPERKGVTARERQETKNKTTHAVIASRHVHPKKNESSFFLSSAVGLVFEGVYACSDAKMKEAKKSRLKKREKKTNRQAKKGRSKKRKERRTQRKERIAKRKERITKRKDREKI